MELTPEKKIGGILAPLFALRRDGDLGIGDVGALRDFVDWCAELGFGLVQILPINETGEDNSPYNAVSSVALDPTTIQADPGTLKDLSQEDFAEVVAGVDLEAMRRGPVDYRQVKLLKRELLWRAFVAFEAKLARKSSSAGKFHQFCRRQKAWLKDYVLFRVLMDRNGNEQWDLWPKEQQTAESARAWLKKLPVAQRRTLDRQMDFHAYVQWIAYSQWAKLKKHCDKRGVALMGDIPIGVSYYSSDVFSRPEIFDPGWSGGAPPERIFKSDPFTAKWGQNWGVPLYNWDRLRACDFDWWRQRVHMVREVFHLFRIDHILGFYRIYAFPWRPQRNDEFLPLSGDEAMARTDGRLPGFKQFPDDTWEHMEANRRQGEELLRMLLEVTGEHRLIGEDLGVVPEYVRPSLASLAIAGFKIPMWERGWDGRLIPGASYQRLSVTTYATHDHPPVRTFWEGWVERLKQAESGDAGAIREADGIRREMQVLADFAGIEISATGVPYSDGTREALMRALFASNSWLAVPMITDLFGATDRFNVPGAVAESNWSNRMAKPVTAWSTDKEIAPKMQRIGKMLKQTGRAI